MNVSEVIQTLDSEDFDDPMAERSDDLGMDVDYDYDSDNSEGIIEYNYFYHKNTKVINST